MRRRTHRSSRVSLFSRPHTGSSESARSSHTGRSGSIKPQTADRRRGMADDPRPLRYLRSRWSESPGPDQDWGHSTWLMKLDADGNVLEQFEI
jgi:hypothetical protein